MDYEKRTFNIHFFHVNESGNIVEDETQFDVTSCYNVESIMNELIHLFNDFVDENDFANVTITGIDEVPYDGEDDEDEPYIITKDKYGVKYKVYAPDRVLEELKRNEELADEDEYQFGYLRQTWSGDSYRNYLDEDGNGYSVEVDGNVVQIYPL